MNRTGRNVYEDIIYMYEFVPDKLISELLLKFLKSQGDENGPKVI